MCAGTAFSSLKLIGTRQEGRAEDYKVYLVSFKRVKSVLFNLAALKIEPRLQLPREAKCENGLTLNSGQQTENDSIEKYCPESERGDGRLSHFITKVCASVLSFWTRQQLARVWAFGPHYSLLLLGPWLGQAAQSVCSYCRLWLHFQSPAILFGGSCSSILVRRLVRLESQGPDAVTWGDRDCSSGSRRFLTLPGILHTDRWAKNCFLLLF